jgi:hypothetical protein
MKRLLLLGVIVLIAVSLFMLLQQRLSRSLSRNMDGDRTATDRPRAASGWLLFVLPLPVAAAAMVALARGQLLLLVGDAIGYGLFLGGAILMRRGLLSAGKLSAEPWPLKTLGSVLISLATAITAWLGVGHHPAIAAAFGIIALLGCYLTYGFDLNRSRLFREGRGVNASARAMLAQAERSIAAIEQSSRDIRQHELNGRLTRITALATQILRRLEEDPRDLRRASKFLVIYLEGVERVVQGYAKTHAQVAAPDLDERFRHALVTIEDAFQEQQQRLLESDVEDLDVQIEVLTQQRKREGIL